MVIVSVPIQATEAVIREVGPHVRKDGLLMDVTSVKQMPLDVMLASTEASVVGTHPMFGPGVHTFQGQRVVVCRGRGDAWWDWLTQTLRALEQAADSSDVLAEAFKSLAENPKDIPFALGYAWTGPGPGLGQGQGSGHGSGHGSEQSPGTESAERGRLDPVAVSSPVPLSEQHLAAAGARLREVFASGARVVIDEVASVFGAAVPSAWPEPVRTAVALPIRRAPTDSPSGVLVFGVSPCLHFDARYAAFFEDIARQIAVLRESAEAKRIERELVVREQAARDEADAQRARLQAVFMQAPVAITILRGPQFVVELANPLMLRVWGRPLEHVLGQPMFEALPDLAGQGIEAMLTRVLQTATTLVGTELPVRIARLEGGAIEECFFNYVYEPMRGPSGAIEGVIVVAVDVTGLVVARQGTERLAAELKASQKAAESAREAAESANRAKDEFLAMLSHELRNPLAPILTALELMRMRDESGRLARERSVIERQADHMTRLVEDLLDVSRITRGKIELKRERVELSSIVTQAIETASPLLQKARHALIVDVAAEGLWLDGDTARLVQVFANLLTNAAKYTPAGGTIRITARREGDAIVASVIDNGRGIAAEMLPRLFDLFVQERQNLDRSEGGLGLGLAIVRNLIELHGGRIEVKSEGRQRGSTFTVHLPGARETAVAAHLPEPGAPSRPTADAVDPRSSSRILVVDDNEDAAELLSEALSALGYLVEVLHSGVDALALAQRARFDAVLLDIGPPVLDGYEVARRLRRLAGWEQTPLVAVTGYGQESDKQLARAAGFTQHLVKPIDLAALDQILQLLRRR